MIRTDRLSLSTEDFAAERKNILDRADDQLRDPVRAALMRLGLRRWEDGIVAAALDVFDETARAEVDEWSQVIDDMRDEFERELRETLLKTKTGQNRQAQIETITRWVSTMSVNAATEAATTADPDELVGLEWITMSDRDVREMHQEAHGQVVPTGSAFSVGEYQLLYPGQPVGPPEVWINCRCVAAPTKLDAFVSQSVTASLSDDYKKRLLAKYPDAELRLTAGGKTLAERDDEDGPVSLHEPKNTSSVIVALPKQGDPVIAASSEDMAHVTLLWLGEAADFDPADIERALEAYTSTFAPDPFDEKISGSGILGEGKAQVLLLDAQNLAHIRTALLQDSHIYDRHNAVEQFPAWIPHLTLGYPDALPRHEYNEESITFDRIALWHGDEQKEFTLAQEKIKTESSDALRALYPEDGAEFDALVAAAEFDPEAPELAEGDHEPVPWHSVLAPEGVPSGDKRQFGVEALTHRELPLPLKAMFIDDEGHKGSVIVGRIDRIFREDGLVKAEGVFDANPNAYEAIRMLANQMWRGISVDVDQMEGAIDEEDDRLTVYSAARIASATMCPIPAFAEAFIALGLWEHATPKDDGSALAKDLEDMGATVKDREEAAAGRVVLSETKPGEYSVLTYCEDEALGLKSRTTFSAAPGLKKDGTPPRCDFCEKDSTQYVLWAEGMAYVPACDDHIGQAEAAIEDPEDIVRVGEYSAEREAAGTEWPESHEFAPVPRKTKDGPGWITDPKPTKRITDYWVDGPGAAKISWGQPGDFNRCRANLGKYVQNPDWLAGLCANLHYRALRAWPGQASGGTEEMTPKESMTASVNIVETEHETLNADWFRDPELKELTPFTVTADGQVYGHLASWDMCHIGYQECKTAPHSATNYAYFLTGEVFTDAGPIPVGQITLGGGHADGRAGVRAAASHYDSTSTAIADVTVGEDLFGIWVAGALRSNVDADAKRALRAAVLSGDWRGVRKVNGESNLEMVAAHAVNVPGFPVPRPALVASGTDVISLVAGGVLHADDRIADVDVHKLLNDTLTQRINEALDARERARKAGEVRKKMRQRSLQGIRSSMSNGGR